MLILARYYEPTLLRPARDDITNKTSVRIKISDLLLPHVIYEVINISYVYNSQVYLHYASHQKYPTEKEQIWECLSW